MKKQAKQCPPFRSAMLTVAVLLMSLISFSASAYDFEIDGISYNIESAEEHTVSVQSLKNVPKGADCVIPESVTWNDTRYSVVEMSLSSAYYCKTISIPASVTSIKRSYFLFYNEFTDIIVDEQNPVYCSVDGVLYNKNMTQMLWYPSGKPDITYSVLSTVTTVGDDAFSQCENLQRIILPLSLKSVGRYSFQFCRSLLSIDFPDLVESIGYGAIGGCSNLQTISIGKSLSEIGDNLFNGCNSLTEINVDKENKNFCSIDGVLYRNLNATELELVIFPLGKNAESFSFPNTVTALGPYAFNYCKTLTDIVLPNTIKKIGERVFANSSLRRITIPASVSEIGTMVFWTCQDLIEITVSKENPVFSSVDGILYKNNQTSLLWCPEGYQAIELDIPEGVSEIGGDAFTRCSKIEKINIPESVTSIGPNAFYRCTSLKSIIIPNSVEILNGSVLERCENLQTVTIGKSVQIIYGYTFTSDRNINTITCLPTVPPEVFGSRHFENEVYQTATLYVPKGCKEVYSSAKMWSNFQNIAEIEPVGVSDINAAEGGISIGVENGAIVVSGADDGASVEVYAADGRCVYRGNGKEIAGLARGLYIVRAGSAVSKVIL